MILTPISKLLANPRKAKMKDSIMISLIAGLIGTTAMDLSNVFLWRTRKTEILYGHLSGSMIMRGFRTNQTKNFVLGQLLHMASGAALGIPVFQMLKRTGRDHHLIKGGFVGMMSWGILYDFGQRARIFTSKPHLTKTHYSAMWHNLLYGLTTAQAIVSLSDPSLFPPHRQPTQVQQVSDTPQQMPSYRPAVTDQGIFDEPARGLSH